MEKKRRIQAALGLLSLLAIVLLILSAGTVMAEESMGDNAYVGAQKCMECHEDVVTALGKTPHGQKGFADLSEHECETCHGPGQAHADSGDKSLIRVVSALKSTEVTALCMTCHENGKTSHWKGGLHEQRGLNCTVCHSIHNAKAAPQLKEAKVDLICANCHQQIQAMTMKTSHHPIREGLMTCTSCHNPHGTDTPKMISANSTNEQCYTCHTEKRGPFLFEHPPVRENCANCHNPHGTNNPKLLVAKRPYLCQRCHLDTRHPGTLYDANNLYTSTREFSRSCSNCHLTIHGSNHPSGWTFLR